jgi:hypothetical protein
MQKLIIFIVLITCFCCTNSTKESLSSVSTVDSHSYSTTNQYYNILKGLKHDYVLCYRNVKETSNNISKYGMPVNDSIFVQDSITYWESYKRFFKQETNFIEWLLSFKNDSTKSGIWQLYLNPLSSNISECNLPMSNSRAAINLIENFLAGSGFECYECIMPDRKECILVKYNEIENFLKNNNGKDINELRLRWKKKNAR